MIMKQQTIEEILDQIVSLIPPAINAGWVRKEDVGDLKIYELRIPKSALMSPTDSEFHRGACWMLDEIVCSLRGYPNHGGDIGIMKEIDRIVREAKEIT